MYMYMYKYTYTYTYTYMNMYMYMYKLESALPIFQILNPKPHNPCKQMEKRL